MMLPIAIGILQALHTARGETGPVSHRTWPYATGLLLMIAYAAATGGIGTPVGSPPNLITIAALRKYIDIGFFQWMAVTVPLLIVMYAALALLLYALHREPRKARRDPAANERLAGYLQAERSKLGRWTAGQVNTAIAFAMAVTLWVLPGTIQAIQGSDHPWTKFFQVRLPESAVALMVACLLFIMPTNFRKLEFTMTWKQAVKIDWGTILLFGGGLSLGTLMETTKVADAFGNSVTGLLGVYSLWALVAVTILLSIFLSETTSNTAAAAMIVPIVIPMAIAANLNPIPVALAACLGASFGFMLPVSTPPNAVVYSTGLIPIPKMIRAGFLFDIIGFFIILAGLYILCPLMGWTQPLPPK
jgi:sodium-dependent dicarboxylate transporter 2/3/5